MKKRNKLILSSFITFFVLVVVALGVWVGINQKKAKDILAEVEWYNLEDKEFTITTEEELFQMAALSQYYDFKGQKILLGADIVVNEGEASKWAESAPEDVWIPIKNFAGTFDGKGHTLSGIYAVGVNKSVGLFTDSDAACEIKNFRLENSFIKGLNDKGTGSIIGAGTGTLSNIYSNAIVVCESDNVGGLIGYLKAKKSSEMENCWFDGSVEATSELAHYTGGLVGRVLANASLCKITHCLNTAEVKTLGQEVGGFVGAVTGETTMWLTDSLNVGEVTGPADSLTAGMAIGKLYGSASVNSRTSWTVKGNYVKAVGTTEGTVKGVLGTVAKDEVKGFDAYVNTTLDFDKYWAVVEQDTPVLSYFTKNAPSVAGLERKYDLSWFDEKTTQMHISTVAQLNGLALLSQAYGFSGQTIILDNDLVLNEGKASNWAKNAPKNEWTMPIGRWISEDGVTSGVAFSGTFDGNGHTISGMYINLDSKKAYNWGLFAKTKGTIKNLSLKNSYITGLAGANVGSIAGGLEGATLENVYSNAILDMDTWRIGGLTGIIEGRGKESTIKNCWFDGSVKGRERVGGFVGNINQDVALKIEHGLNSGKISGTSHYIGGLVGIINKCTASITDSLNTGTIERAEGNRTGYYGAISGGVNGDLGLECTATFKNVFFLDDSCAKGYQVDKNHTKYITIIGNGAIQLNEEELTGKNAYAWSSLDFKSYWTTVNNNMPQLRTFAKATQNASGTKMADYSWYSVSGNKYTIKNDKQLWAFSILSRTDDFKDKTVNLAANIVLNNTSKENWFETEGLTNWKPIGRNVTEEGTAIGKAFAGTFDGNGHSISGLYIKLDSTKAFNWGLFAKTSGKIQNLKLVDSHISGVAGGSVGSIAGSLAGATLENVYSNATVTITSEKANTGKNIAGLAGIIEGKASSVINNCWFDGKVSGVQRVGGFVGSIDAASDLTISHGLNSGSIASSSDYVGGFVGLTNKSGLVVTDSLNTGAVTTTATKNYYGAISGAFNAEEGKEATVTLSNVYFLEGSNAKAYQVSGKKYVKLTGNGVVMLKESELTGNNAYVWSMLDFDKYWTTVEKDMPVLQTFADKTEKVSGEKMVAFDWHTLEGTSHKIGSAEELWGLSLMARTDDFAGETVELIKDIELKNQQWQPIGRFVDEDGLAQGKTFMGTFNGQGHEISGLSIELNSTKAFNWGLFAKVSGTIQNLKLVDSKITGVAGGSVGSITGSMAGATIENVYSNANVSISSNKANTGKNIAGLAGIIEGKAVSTISNSWFDGSVSGVERVGGFTGSIDAGSELFVYHGLNSGEVKSSSNYVGGFCGLMNKSAIFLDDCLNTGKVATTSKTSYIGALVGGLNGSKDAEGKATISHTYYSIDSNGKAYQIDNNNAKYVTVAGKGAAGVVHNRLLDEHALYATTLDFTNYWMVVKEDTPVLRLLTTENVVSQVSADISWYNESDKEFTIKTREQMMGFALLSRQNTFAGQTIKLVADLNLNGIIWEPIGQYLDSNGTTTGKVFEGTFDGNNHKVSNLIINVSGKNSMSGLFGKVSGTIENLALENVQITGTSNGKVGSVAGSLAGGTIKNVKSDAVIEIANGTNPNTSANYVGGFVGIVESKTSGIIENCHFEGSVSGNKHVGGFVGLVNGGGKIQITASQNDATVTAAGDYAGGFVGYVNQGTATIADCINKGTVSADSGTAAAQGSIVGCVNGKDGATASLTVNDTYYLLGSYKQGYYASASNITNGYVTIEGNGVVPLTSDELETEDLNIDISWFDLAKTDYTISTSAQMYGFTLLSREYNFSGKTVTLSQDISLEDIIWEPIGLHEYASGKTLGKAFAGTFDGNNHKITDLKISVVNGQKMYGLFGQVTGGTIQNVTLESCEITGTASGKIGSVVGSLNGGKLMNVRSIANIDVKSNFVGGLVGCLEGNKTGSLISCSFAGNVKGDKHIGGLLGFANTGANLTITEGKNSAVVSTYKDDSNVGGLVGYANKGIATITDSKNTGTITGGQNVGGFIGCMSEGTVTFAESEETGIVISSEVTSAKLGRFIGCINGTEDTHATVKLNNVSVESSSSIAPYNIQAGAEPYVEIYEVDTRWYEEHTGDVATDPYLISTRAELFGFAKLSETNNFAGETISLGADIELNDTSSEDWYTATGLTRWQPIGEHKNNNLTVAADYAFAGTFEGNNHKITGLYMVPTGNDTYGLGLFGRKVSGTIQNLKLVDCYIGGEGGEIATANARFGSVAASLTGGEVISVQSDVIIKLKASNVGGLVGRVENSTGNGIQNCWVTGSITGTGDTAGIVGNIAGAVNITGCVSNASVTSTSGNGSGGICGTIEAKNVDVVIEDSVVTGTVISNETTKGTIIGRITQTSSNITLTNIQYKVIDGINAIGSGEVDTQSSVDAISNNADISWFTDFDVNGVVDATNNINNPYVVSNEGELIGVSVMSRITDFAGKTIKLDQDITLTANWIPIGQHRNSSATVGKVFAGTVDGDNHKISNMNIQFTGKEGYQGLFGTVSGTIRNLVLDNAAISGKASNNRVGSVAGTLKGGTLKNVRSNAAISVTANQIGGLVGSVEGGVKSTVENCFFTGSVSGSKNIGGLVGWVNSTPLDVLHSQNNASVSDDDSASTKIGGLCGYVQKSTVNISDSMNNGAVTYQTGDLYGEIVGYVEGDSSKSATVTITNVYCDTSKTPYTVKDNAYSVVNDNSGSEISAAQSNADISWYNATATESKISSKAQLYGFALLSQKYNFAGKTIKLTNDIALNDTTADNWYESASNWTPIGKTTAFTGTFDGDSHTITGLRIYATSGEMHGLFGKVSGVIRNLNLNNVYINGSTSRNKAGTVAGVLDKGTIENVHSQGVVNVNANQIGGIVGQIDGGDTVSTIKKCWFQGSVTGSKNVGGIVGFVNASKIQLEDCLNQASVTASKDARVGGLVGYVKTSKADSYIKRGLNTGTVTATNGTSNKGAIVGVLEGTNLTFENTYYLQVVGLNATSSATTPSGCNAVDSDVLKSTTNPVALGFYDETTNPDGAWIRDAEGYPILKPLGSSNN